MDTGDAHTAGSAMAGYLLVRPRVTAALDEILDHRITTIVAGVGSGKTTALASWARAHPVAWHTATAADGALEQIARAVAEALRLRLPRLAADRRSAAPEGAHTDPNQAERSAARLGQEIDELTAHRRVILVVDDVHEIPVGSPGMSFLSALCRNAPHSLHVVLASRDRIPFSLARFALESELAEIGPRTLAFAPAETAALLADVTGAENPEQAAAIDRLVGGWAAVTRLAVESIRAYPDRSVETLAAGAADDRVFDYLANHVLGAEPVGVRELLRAAAELPWITPRMADDLALGGGGASVETALRRGVYFGRVSGSPDAVTLIPAIRDYLRTLPAPAGHEHLLAAAGDWFAGSGAFAQAIECYRTAAASSALARLLESNGSAALAAGPIAAVIAACESLPAQLRTDRIILLEAEARQLAGDWDGALARYRILDRGEAHIPAGLAWRIGLLHYLRGDPIAARTAYGRGEPDGSTPADEAMLCAWSAAAAWVSGDVEDARELASRALDVARRIDDPRALATAHTVLAMVAASDGDRIANDAHYLRALDHAERARDTMQIIRIRVNRGSRNLEEGAYAAAMEELDEALHLADVSGFAAFRALALSNRGQVLFHQGRLDEAITDLEEARTAYRRINALSESYPLAHLGDVYQLRGDTALARASYEQALALAERAQDVQGLVPALAGLARLLAKDEPDTAAAAAERAVAGVGAIHHADAVLAAGWVVHHAGGDASGLAAQAADTATARRDLSALADALELRAAADPTRATDFLHRALEIWERLGNPVRAAMAEVALAEAGSNADAADAISAAIARLRDHGALGPAREAEARLEALRLAEGAPPLVTTLGGFAVVRDGEPVPTGEWQSKKARDLLKALVVARGKPVHREVLVHRLWPGDDPKVAANRLSVALSTVRAVLDPQRAQPSDHFVHADRETVALDTRALVIDVEIFVERATRGLALWRSGNAAEASAQLETAVATYVGDLLEDDPYEEWVIPLREECRSLYLKVAATLADWAAGQADWDGVARYYLRMLERDPYHEPAHLGLVAAQTRLGRHGSARRLYSHYVARMREIDVEPAPFPRVG